MMIQMLDKVMAGLLALFGVWLIQSGLGYGVMQGTTPGPGLFPMVMGLMIAALSLVNLFRAITGREKLGPGMPIAELLRAGGVVIVLAGFVLAIPYLGMTLAAMLMMAGAGLILRTDKSVTMLLRLGIVSVVVPVVCLLMFDNLLGVPVPSGPLGF